MRRPPVLRSERVEYAGGTEIVDLDVLVDDVGCGLVGVDAGDRVVDEDVDSAMALLQGGGQMRGLIGRSDIEQLGADLRRARGNGRFRLLEALRVATGEIDDVAGVELPSQALDER
jgi:hypothetical protein